MRGFELISAASLQPSTRALLQKTAAWVVTCAAFAALSRTLVHDLDIRMSVLPLPDERGFFVPAAAIEPPPPPPPPPPPTGIDNLMLPVFGVQPSDLTRSFTMHRSGGRLHEALDIMAKRNTPVIAANDGVIANISVNPLGGNTIYQTDNAGEYVFYYAHLQRYARGIKEGSRVAKGQIIGFVGTTGNAPPTIPHLHFAVYKLKIPGQIHDGKPIDPYDLLTEQRFAGQCEFKSNQRQGAEAQRDARMSC
jgi:murein DD-endopeptidase MepM/ murein hydrolase activator NlpD